MTCFVQIDDIEIFCASHKAKHVGCGLTFVQTQIQNHKRDLHRGPLQMEART